MRNMFNFHPRPRIGFINFALFDHAANKGFVSTDYITITLHSHRNIEIADLLAVKIKVAKPTTRMAKEQPNFM